MGTSRGTAQLILRLEGITKSFASGQGSVQVLNGVDFELARGEFVAIKGPSGAGKTTLLHIAAGLDAPTSGRVEFDGLDLGGFDEREMTKLRRERLGFIFQFFNLVPGLDVRDNVALPLLLDGVPRKLAAQTTEEALAAVGMSHRMDHLVSDISGGEMQRTAIARAVAPQPDVIFADEPTGNLDSQTGETILDLIANICAERETAVMMVTHDDHAAARADRVIEVRDGRIRSDAEASREPERPIESVAQGN